MSLILFSEGEIMSRLPTKYIRTSHQKCRYNRGTPLRLICLPLCACWKHFFSSQRWPIFTFSCAQESLHVKHVSAIKLCLEPIIFRIPESREILNVPVMSAYLQLNLSSLCIGKVEQKCHLNVENKDICTKPFCHWTVVWYQYWWLIVQIIYLPHCICYL